MHYLVTGGCGYIGGATAALLCEQKDTHVTLLDNLLNNNADTASTLQSMYPGRVHFVNADVRDLGALRQVFSSTHFDAVMHFAGLKSVSESQADPLAYYDHNFTGTRTLCQVMSEYGIFSLVFSSSATVYGIPEKPLALTESAPTVPLTPYGRSKLYCENLLSDLAKSDPRWAIAVLRYFNPIGAHPSGLLGENPIGKPNNLMPIVMEVASGVRERVDIYGADYLTHDGTGVRDYIHVMDLAEGHLAALSYIKKVKGVDVFNLGCGRGYSVLQLIFAVTEHTGMDVPYRIVEARQGDAASVFADTSKARRLLYWSARLDLQDMVADHWRWAQKLSSIEGLQKVV